MPRLSKPTQKENQEIPEIGKIPEIRLEYNRHSTIHREPFQVGFVEYLELEKLKQAHEEHTKTNNGIGDR